MDSQAVTPLATFSLDLTKSHCGIPYFYPRKQPGFYPIEFPKSLNDNGILEDVKKLLQNINHSFKKYALPVCPIFILFVVPYLALILPISPLPFTKQVHFSILTYLPAIIVGICIAVSCFMHYKRRSGIKKAINEFNQTLINKKIWAQWTNNPNDENDDWESHFEDYYTGNTCISMICRGKSRRARRAVLIIKKRGRRGNVLSSGFENYASMRNYAVPAPQLPYQVV